MAAGVLRRPAGQPAELIACNMEISVCAKEAQWQVALQTLAALPRRSLQPSTVSYNATMKACQGASEWHLALALLAELCRGGLQATQISFSTAISACEGLSQWPLALELLGCLAATDLEPNRILCNAATGVCATGHAWEEAVELTKVSMLKQISPDSFTCTVSLGFDSRGPWPKALQVLSFNLDHAVELGVISYNAVINVVAAWGRWRVALLGTRQLEEGRLRPSMATLHAAMKACQQAGRWQRVLQSLHRLHQQGHQWDLVSFGTAAGGCGSARWALAASLCSLQKAMLRSSGVVSSAALSAVANTGPWSEALLCFRALLFAGIQVQSSSLVDLLTGAAAGSWRLAVHLAPPAELGHVRGLLALLGAFAHQELWADAMAWLHWASASTPSEASLVCCNAALSACEKGGAWRRGSCLLAQLPSCRLHATVVTFSSAVSACEKRAEWAEAQLLLARLREDGLEPNEVTYSAMTSACGKGKQWQQAGLVFGTLLAGHLEVSLIAYNAALAACEKRQQWQPTLKLLSQLASKALLPDRISYDAVLSACCGALTWRRVLHLFEGILRRSVEVDLMVYNSALSACDAGGTWEAALLLIERLSAEGLEPSVVSYTAAVAACRSWAWRMALMLLDCAATAGVQSNAVTYQAAMEACEPQSRRVRWRGPGCPWRRSFRAKPSEPASYWGFKTTLGWQGGTKSAKATRACPPAHEARHWAPGARQGALPSGRGDRPSFSEGRTHRG
eukprot:s2589_g3.t1